MKKSELKNLIRGIIQEAKKTNGFSGFKKAPDAKENTRMKADTKNITSSTEPKEIEASKKLPVVTRIPTPKIVKEDVMAMIREALVAEMAKSPVTIENGVVKGGIATKFRKPDANSVTGWVMSGHPKIPDGTPVEAPKNTGVNYVPRGNVQTAATATVTPVSGERATADGGDDEEEEEVAPAPTAATPSGINVLVNGKSIGKFSFKLPSGKPDTRPMKVMVNSFIYKNPDMGAYDITQSVFDKFDEMSDLYSDDKLPANASIKLSVSGDKLMAVA